MKCIDSILVEKYSGYTFYIHNFRNFDVYFIFRLLIAHPEKYSCNPYFRDDSIIGLKLSSKNTKKVFSIKIVDSRNFLPESLDELCKSFDTPVKKGYFPYNFVSRNSLFYKGIKPEYSYYDLINKSKVMPIEDYNNIPLEDWDIQKETISYLENDLISLFNVMEQFINKVYINYNVHVTNSLTISSLTMDIFLRQYHKAGDIPLIKQKSTYNDIKKSYYGGVTEVYKPYGKNLYYYDVNSLYPFASLNPMPGTKCIYTDNIDKNFGDLNEIFGFFYCKVKASDKYIGLLPYRSDEGLTMPIGEFEGWYFSEELKFAYENGYTIQVLKGYHFNRVYNVFTGYVRELYRTKSTTKDDVERQTVKSLLNNLLGRFGLDINKYVTSLVSLDEFKELIQIRKFRSVKFVGEKVLLSYEKEINKEICYDHSLDYKEVVSNYMNNSNNKFSEENYHDVSVAISSCVTAYSRIYMNKVKLDVLSKGGSIYYTDTDSIVTDIKLDNNIVGADIGQFKLVHNIKEGYFISNKTYGIINEKDKEILRSKGVYKDEFTYDKLKSLYSGEEVKTNRYKTVKSFTKGSAVLFVKDPITLQPNSYEKRLKVYGENNLWIDTRPINKSYHTYNKYKKKNVKNILFKTLCYSGVFVLNISLLLLFMSLIFYFTNCQYIEGNILENVDNSIFREVEHRLSDSFTIQNNFFDSNSNNTHKPLNYLNNNFIDKFKVKDNNLIIHVGENMRCSNNVSGGHDSSKVNVLNEVFKHHINELVDENNKLRDKISYIEIELQKKKITNMGRKILLNSLIKEIECMMSNRK